MVNERLQTVNANRKGTFYELQTIQCLPFISMLMNGLFIVIITLKALINPLTLGWTNQCEIIKRKDSYFLFQFFFFFSESKLNCSWTGLWSDSGYCKWLNFIPLETNEWKLVFSWKKYEEMPFTDQLILTKIYEISSCKN